MDQTTSSLDKDNFIDNQPSHASNVYETDLTKKKDSIIFREYNTIKFCDRELPMKCVWQSINWIKHQRNFSQDLDFSKTQLSPGENVKDNQQPLHFVCNNENSYETIVTTGFVEQNTAQDKSTEDCSSLIQVSSRNKKRRSRNERSKMQGSISILDPFKFNPNKNSYYSMQISSNDCSERHFESQILLEDQIQDKTIENCSNSGTLSRKISESELVKANNQAPLSILLNRLCVQEKGDDTLDTQKKGLQEEKRIDSNRDSKDNENSITHNISTYRSLQGRLTNRSFDNRFLSYREVYDCKDTEKHSNSVLICLKLNENDTYRERSESRKRIKGDIKHKGCSTSRSRDKTDNLSSRNLNILSRNFDKQILIDTEHISYKDMRRRKESCQINQTTLNKSQVRSNKENQINSIKSQRTVQTKSCNTKASEKQKLKGDLVLEPKKREVSQLIKMEENNKNKSEKLKETEEKQKKPLKGPPTKTTVEATYYADIMRKKKLVEKLVQPRTRNNNISARENSYSGVRGLKDDIYTSKDKYMGLVSDRRALAEKEPCNTSREHSMIFTGRETNRMVGNESFRGNFDNKKLFDLNKKFEEDSYSVLKTFRRRTQSKENNSTSTLAKPQPKNVTPRLDRLNDKTKAEHVCISKESSKSIERTQNSLNTKVPHMRRQSIALTNPSSLEQSYIDSARGREGQKMKNMLESREDPIWSKVLGEAGKNIGIDGITKAWETFAGKQIKLEEREKIIMKKLNTIQENNIETLEDKRVISTLADEKDMMEINKKSGPKQNQELLVEKVEENRIIQEDGKTNNFFKPWDLVRKVEEAAAIKIQRFFKRHIKNKCRSSRHEPTKKNNNYRDILLKSFDNYEKLYDKIYATLYSENPRCSQKEMAMAFVSAYSCLKSCSLSIKEVQEMMQKINGNQK